MNLNVNLVLSPCAGCILIKMVTCVLFNVHTATPPANLLYSIHHVQNRLERYSISITTITSKGKVIVVVINHIKLNQGNIPVSKLNLFRAQIGIPLP